MLHKFDRFRRRYEEAPDQVCICAPVSPYMYASYFTAPKRLSQATTYGLQTDDTNRQQKSSTCKPKYRTYNPTYIYLPQNISRPLPDGPNLAEVHTIYCLLQKGGMVKVRCNVLCVIYTGLMSWIVMLCISSACIVMVMDSFLPFLQYNFEEVGVEQRQRGDNAASGPA